MTLDVLFTSTKLVAVRRVALPIVRRLRQNTPFKLCVCCSRQNLKSSDDGSVGTLAVLVAHWSVITRYRGVFELMNFNELS